MAKQKKRNNKKSNISSYTGIILIFIFLVCLFLGYLGYKRFFSANIRISSGDNLKYLYIPTGYTFKDVEGLLVKYHYLIDNKSFEWMALKMKYPNHVKAGKYLLKDGMNNRELIHMLRSGQQVSVKLVINNIRLKKDLASQVSRQIEADSVSLFKYMNNDNVLAGTGFNKYTIMAVFIPNTYDFYWNTSVEEFFTRMHSEYNKFWNDDRLQKCRNAGLSAVEVSILASIVEEETQKKDERPEIAGLYINRLRKGMLLQADPTIRFALGDFKIKRVLKKYKEIDSKYNTYKYYGLPPGPICIPSINSIEAVLNYKDNEYLYMCAKDDFSGYHTFARTIEQHNRNAQKYQNALNRSGIMK